MSGKAIIYGAKSTADPHGSIPTQLAQAREMAQREGWTVEAEYMDEDATAYKGNRGDGLARAKAHVAGLADGGHPAVLVLQHSDRLARGDGVTADHLVELALWARKVGVRITSVQDPQTFEGGLAFAAMMGDRNYEDSRRKSLAVRDGMQRRAENKGLLAGGPRPYGYRWEGPKNEKRLLHVSVEARVVERIFADTVAGLSQMAIAKALTVEHVPSAKGGEWTQATVGRILRNPLYKGFVRHNGREFDGQHEAIVSVELWESAAKIREQAASVRGNAGGRKPRAAHLFTRGLLRCACGSALVPRTDPERRGGPYEVYICDGRRRLGPDHCPQKPISRIQVDGAMLAEFERLYLDFDATRERVAAKIAADATITADLLALAEREAQVAAERYSRVQRAFQDGTIEADDWAEQRPDLLAEREAAHAAVERAREQAAALAESRPLLDAEDEVLRMLAELRIAIVQHEANAARNLDGLRRTMHHLFEKVIYRPVEADAQIMRLAQYRESVVEVPGAFLEPYLRAQVVEGYTDEVRPIVRRTTLAETTEAEGFAM